MQVPEEDTEYDPDGPPCTPFPGSILILGGYRWLGMDGHLRTIPLEMAEFAEDVKGYAAKGSGDPQVLVASELFEERAVYLDRRTLAYWEAAALRGQDIPLSELFA